MPERIQLRRTKGWRWIVEHLHELTGRDLACFCPLPEPGEIDWCHARILIEESAR